MSFVHRGISRIVAAVSFALIAGSARADHFVVADETYTHSAETTEDSHYRVTPKAETPKDWTKPVDYRTGYAHLLLEVKTKPKGGTPTKFQVCFEGPSSYACTAQSKTYTEPGVYPWITKFSDPSFYQSQQMNWAAGVKKVALILKDTNNNKPQGDPKYVPSDLHVRVTIVSGDDKFVPPDSFTPTDAGVAMPDAGTSTDAGVSKDASVFVDAGSDDTDEVDAATPVKVDASTPVRRDASTSPADAGKQDDEPVDSDDAPATAKSSSDGCALGARGDTGMSWAFAALGLALTIRRRRRG